MRCLNPAQRQANELREGLRRRAGGKEKIDREPEGPVRGEVELGRRARAQTQGPVELALRIGLPQAARAVGLANGRNPISIVVPCHRVIGKTGALVGYGGGLERKQWLLAHEQRHAPGAQQRLPGL